MKIKNTKLDIVAHTYNPALRRVRQEDHQGFKASQAYIIQGQPEYTVIKTKKNITRENNLFLG